MDGFKLPCCRNAVVVGTEAIQTVNARELHGFLGSSKQFSNWIQDRITRYGFAVNVDYVSSKLSSLNGGAARIEYHVSLDMAKELAMVERNDQGRKAVAPIPTLNIVTTDGVQTMSSLDMVAFINATRESGKAELRHDHFLAKVPNVLGYSSSPKFLGHDNVVVGKGATRRIPVYNFPRREAMLMAMSYSYKLQATVYDAWQAAEAKGQDN